MRKFIYSVLIFTLAFFVIPASDVFAEVRTSEKGNISVTKTEVVNDDLFIGALNTVIDGTVNGDVFIGAQNVTINGSVNGNLHVMGNSITLNGNIKGNVYVAAGNINVNSATIGGSLLAGAQNVNINKESTVGGSVMVGAASARIDSQIKRSGYVGAASATLGPNTVIGKDFYYEVGKINEEPNINIDKNAVIKGETYKHIANLGGSHTIKTQVDKDFNNFKLFTKILSFVSALIVGFLYYKLLNDNFIGSAKRVTNSFWKSFSVGLLITVITLPVFILLLFTVVGIQIVWVSSLLLMLGLYLSKIAVGYALGNWISLKLKWKKISPFWAMALGLLLIFILKAVPQVGFLASLLTAWVGLGALTLHTFSRTNKTSA